MYRPLHFLGLVFCVSQAEKFKMFFKTSTENGNVCADVLFTEPFNLSKCAILCEANTLCKRFFFFPSNYCEGCSSTSGQMSPTSVASSSYVLGGPLRYVGCYDEAFDHNLGLVHGNYNMTNKLCGQLCKERQFIYAGTVHGVYCRCGNSYDEAGRRPDEECNYPCDIDRTQMCGGPHKLSIYTHRAN